MKSSTLKRTLALSLAVIVSTWSAPVTSLAAEENATGTNYDEREMLVVFDEGVSNKKIDKSILWRLIY